MLAAVMNKYGLNSSIYGSTLLVDAQTALCNSSSSKATLIDLAGQIASITEDNDGGTLPPSIPLGADPKAAKMAALISEWDMVLP